MYSNFLFDLYGTLVDIHTDEDKSEVWEKLSLFYGYYKAVYTPEELKSAYLKEVKRMQEQLYGSHSDRAEGERKADTHEAHPEIQLEYVFQNLFAQKGVAADLRQSMMAGQVFRIASTEYIRLYEGAEALLRALKREGHKIYLLSNAQSIFTRYELNYLGIEELFDDIFISSEYGCKKPDPRFFRVPIQKYGLAPDTTIMIGNDQVCDISGASEMGLDTFYIHSNLSPDLKEEIKSTYQLMTMDLNKVQDVLLHLAQ